MKILVACEESQTVCKALRAKGHEAYSCDILPASGGHPEWHIQGDIRDVLKQEWDMIIAHPPCTYLTLAGNRWFAEKYKSRYPTRIQDRKDAVEFFMLFANHSCPKIAIENPPGYMTTAWRKPDQYIQPYEFGEPARKKTGLWLKGLPPLKPTKLVKPNLKYYKNGKSFSADYMDGVKRSKPGDSMTSRSKTYQGIADAMAEQWG